MTLAFLHKYQRLIHRYLRAEMATDAFAREYLALFQAETNPLTVAVYEALNDLFSATERFCPDPSLADADDTSDADVRAAAVASLGRLERLLSKAS